MELRHCDIIPSLTLSLSFAHSANDRESVREGMMSSCQQQAMTCYLEIAALCSLHHKTRLCSCHHGCCGVTSLPDFSQVAVSQTQLLRCEIEKATSICKDGKNEIDFLKSIVYLFLERQWINSVLCVHKIGKQNMSY